jgi:hypothetical protein
MVITCAFLSSNQLSAIFDNNYKKFFNFILMMKSMPFLRKEYDPERKLNVYHCDDHGFKSHNPSEVEKHLAQHGRSAASFWKRSHHEEKKVTVYHCDAHDFHSYDVMEIEEHERFHELTSVGWGVI